MAASYGNDGPSGPGFGDEPTPNLRGPVEGPGFVDEPTPNLRPAAAGGGIAPDSGAARDLPELPPAPVAGGERPPRSGRITSYTPPVQPVRRQASGDAVGSPRLDDGGKLPEQGTSMGRYQLTGLLAEGGMARVYHAVLRDESGFEKPLAIKCMHSRLCEDPEFIKRFVDEARIASTLSHSNIVQVFDFGTGQGGRYYLAMELVQGPDLGALMDRLKQADRPMPVPAALYIGAGTLRGLGAAHGRVGSDGRPAPVVHRDMSPQNILISLSGEVKVADFGIAKAADKLVQTRAGVIMGKYFYMSPEQCRGEVVDTRTDIFAVGCVMFEMLTGRSLWSGSTPREVVHQVLHGPIPPVMMLNPAVPRELDQILDRALSRDPARRYADGNAMARELEKLLHRMAPGYSRDDLSDLVRAVEPGLEEAPGDDAPLWAGEDDGSPSLDDLRRRGPGPEAFEEPPERPPPGGAEGVELGRPGTEIMPLSDALADTVPSASLEPEPPPRRRITVALVLAAALLLGAAAGAGGAVLSDDVREVALAKGSPVSAGPWTVTLQGTRRSETLAGPRLMLELWTNQDDPDAGRLFSMGGAPPLLWTTDTKEGKTLLRLIFKGPAGPVHFQPPDQAPVVLKLK